MGFGLKTKAGGCQIRQPQEVPHGGVPCDHVESGTRTKSGSNSFATTGLSRAPTKRRPQQHQRRILHCITGRWVEEFQRDCQHLAEPQITISTCRGLCTRALAHAHSTRSISLILPTARATTRVAQGPPQWYHRDREASRTLCRTAPPNGRLGRQAQWRPGTLGLPLPSVCRPLNIVGQRIFLCSSGVSFWGMPGSMYGHTSQCLAHGRAHREWYASRSAWRRCALEQRVTFCTERTAR